MKDVKSKTMKNGVKSKTVKKVLSSEAKKDQEESLWCNGYELDCALRFAFGVILLGKVMKPLSYSPAKG